MDFCSCPAVPHLEPKKVRSVQPFTVLCRHSDFFVSRALTTWDEREREEERKKRPAIFKCLSKTGQNPHEKRDTWMMCWYWKSDNSPPSPELPLPPSSGQYWFPKTLPLDVCLPECRQPPLAQHGAPHYATTSAWITNLRMVLKLVASFSSDEPGFASRGVMTKSAAKLKAQCCGAEPAQLLYLFTLCPAKGAHGLLPDISCDSSVFG